MGVFKDIEEAWTVGDNAAHSVNNAWGDISPLWGGSGMPLTDDVADASWFPGSQHAPNQQIAEAGMVPQRIRGLAGIDLANDDLLRKQARDRRIKEHRGQCEADWDKEGHYEITGPLTKERDIQECMAHYAD
jgi:hypothetical protein